MSLKPTPHPCLPVFTDAELLSLMEQPDGAAQYADWFNRREELIRKAKADPLTFGFEPAFEFPEVAGGSVASAQRRPTVKPFEEADRLLNEECDILAIFGGNRAMKSYYAAKRLAECIRLFPGAVFAAMAEKEATSVAQQQQLLWHFLQPHYGHLNDKRDPRKVFKINYSPAGGFTEGKAVFPNRSELYLLTYKQTATDYEGWEFGASKEVYDKVSRNSGRLDSGARRTSAVGRMNR